MQIQSIQTNGGYITERRYGRKRVKAVLFEAFENGNGTQLLRPLSKEKLEEIERSRLVNNKPMVRTIQMPIAGMIPRIETSREKIVTILLSSKQSTARQCGRSCVGLRKRVQAVHGFETRKDLKESIWITSQYMRQSRFDEDEYREKPISWKARRTTQYK